MLQVITVPPRRNQPPKPGSSTSARSVQYLNSIPPSLATYALTYARLLGARPPRQDHRHQIVNIDKTTGIATGQTV